MEKKTDGKHLDYFIKVDGKYTPLSMVSGSVDQILDLEPDGERYVRYLRVDGRNGRAFV